MERPELFNHSVNVLVQAFQRGDLNALDCAACAVGNLVAAGCGLKRIGYNRFIKDEKNRPASFQTSMWRDSVYSSFNFFMETQMGFEQVDSTGYTKEELSQIERAFLIGTGVVKPDEDHIFISNVWNENHNSIDSQFNGLMAVVDVLMQIHEADQVTTDQAKALFVR